MESVAELSDSYTVQSVLLIEPDDAIRRSLLSWLRSAVPEYLAAGAASTEEAMGPPQCKWPSVVVVDIADPGGDGVTTIRRIRGAMRCPHVVALTMCETPEYCEALACAGASASLLIWRTYRELPVMIRRLLADDGHRESPGR